MYAQQIEEDNKRLAERFSNLSTEDLEYLTNYNNPFRDVTEFNKLYSLRTNKQSPGKINAKFLLAKMQEEMDEIKEDLDNPVNVIDGAIDAMYYICQILTFAHPELDYTKIWKLVHKANLTKFTDKGHLDTDGQKWIKPPDFVAPDEEIKQTIDKSLK